MLVAGSDNARMRFERTIVERTVEFGRGQFGRRVRCNRPDPVPPANHCPRSKTVAHPSPPAAGRAWTMFAVSSPRWGAALRADSFERARGGLPSVGRAGDQCLSAEGVGELLDLGAQLFDER
jgi:hypothetical protein